MLRATLNKANGGRGRRNAFEAYLVLFIFTMINREFLLFGLDLRFIIVILGFCLVVWGLFEGIGREKSWLRCAKNNLIKSNRRDNSNGVSNALMLFYAFVVLSNISWLWNGLSDYLERVNEFVLIGNMTIAVLVFHLNSHFIDVRRVRMYVVLSCLILTISIVLVHQGFTLVQIGGSPDVAYIYHGVEQSHHYNLYGEDFRAAGYASDPNYATMLLLIGIICAILLKCKVYVKVILTVIMVFGVTLSFSKTIMVASVVCAAYVGISARFRIDRIRVFDRIFVSTIIIASLIAPLLSFLKLPLTLELRLEMWYAAWELFVRNPLIGSGISSFRSYFLMVRRWYVHCHSTYWQLLSETGIIGLLLYLRVVFRALDQSLKNGSVLMRFLILAFAVWAATYETIALQMGLFVFLLGNINNDKKRFSKKALFFVNSLKQGGAEKVCVNLANELVVEGYTVEFIVLNMEGAEIFDGEERVKLYDLNLYGSKLRQLVGFPRVIFKANSIIIGGERYGEAYGLITSHLPISNLITRYSYVENKAIYTFHISTYAYKVCNMFVYRCIMRYLFGLRKIVTVSKKLRKEVLDDYGFSSEYVRTIYNPVDMRRIKNSNYNRCAIDEPYIIHVGRFAELKRQDRMVDIFYKGKFYDKYRLVFCGVGKNLDAIKQQVSKYGIQDRVDFIGWRDDVYGWIKGAQLLVCTSDYESFGMVIVEALACGTRVVSSDCSSGPDEILIGDLAAYLVDPNDIDDYIVKMNMALNDYPVIEPSLLVKFEPKRVVKEYVSFYEKR